MISESVMFKILRITGRSMLPTLPPDTFVLAVKMPFSRVNLKDLVVVRTATFGTVVKRVIAVNTAKDTFYLSGDNIAESISANQIGVVNKGDLIGKVYWSVKPALPRQVSSK